MQRVLRTNLRARNRALKAARQADYDEYRKDWKDFAQRESMVEKVKQEDIRAEKKARREDWLLGPLAPKRDVGTKQGFYGMANGLIAQPPVFPPRIRHGPKGDGWDPSIGKPGGPKGWEGVGNEGNIVAGDRVCVVKGKSSLIGKIGDVKEVDSASKVLKITGLNTADIEIPETAPEYREKYRSQVDELPIPLADVQLVHRLTDETTGKDRDVLVKLIRGGAPYVQQEPNSPLPSHTRYIAGEEILIPWPEADIPTLQGTDADTTRYDVETHTWTPTLFTEPVPADAFEELTLDTKYSHDRQWHELEYVRMKVLEDARSQWYKNRKIQSPEAALSERKIQQASEKAKAQNATGMAPETICIIQEAMQQAQARQMETKQKKIKAVA